MIVERMTDLIGNTPLLKIPDELTGLKNIDLYGKLEMLNPFGSVKDRVAWAMLRDDISSIKERGQTVFENSSGNTAKAIAAIAGVYGIPFKLVTALAKVQEPKDVLKVLGAEIEEMAAASDCFDPNDPNDPQFLIEKAVRESGGKAFFTSQFTNQKNPDVHETGTAQEILKDLSRVDYLVGGLGTTGSTLGLARAFKKENKAFQCIGLVAANGQHIPGIRSLDQMWESGLYREDKYDRTFEVTEYDAIEGMLTLNRKMGLLCGPTAGSNFSGAITYLQTIDANFQERKKAVFIVCDRMEWYLSYLRKRRPEIFGEAEKTGSLHMFTTYEIPPAIEAVDVTEWTNLHQPTIIDVRMPQAYRMGSLPEAINLPLEIFERLVNNSAPFPKNRPLLLVCAQGEKTSRLAAYLRTQGYEAYNLAGGMMDWKKMRVAA